MLKLEAWARDGLTDEQIAENIGITQSTLYEWKKKYSEISESLKRGKEIVSMTDLFRCMIGTYQNKSVMLKRHGGLEIS